MKKQLSTLGLLTRSVLGPLVTIALVAAALQTALFAVALHTERDAWWGEGLPVFEYLVSHSGVAAVSALGLAALCLLLCRCCAGGGSRCQYTLGRLAVSESCFFWQQAVVSCLALLIYWGCQLATVLALGAWYLRQPLADGGPSALPLAFWRSAFLHGLLPGPDVLRWVVDGLLLLALGLCTAAFAHCQRHQRRSLPVVAVAPFTLISFFLGYESAGSCLVLAIGGLFTGAVAVAQALWPNAED